MHIDIRRTGIVGLFVTILVCYSIQTPSGPEKVSFSAEKVSFRILKVTFSGEKISFRKLKVSFSEP